MDMINKFFSNLAEMLDSEIDAAVAAVEVEGILAKARFRAAVKKAGNEFRRLKMALGLDADSVALKIETVGLLSDSEIVQKFFSLTEDDQSDLVVGLEEMGTRGPRILELIQAKIDSDAAEAKADAEAKAEAARIRAYELAHPEVLVGAGIPVDDAVALSFIQTQPNGYFQRVSDVKALEKDIDGAVFVKSMFTGKMIPATEAKVLRLCFVCEEVVANRLRKLLGKAERFHHWDETQRWLAEREAEAAQRQAAQDALIAEVTTILSESAAYADGSQVWDHVSLARAMDRFLNAKAEAGQTVEGWQERITAQVYEEYTEKARFAYVGRLREQFSAVGSADLDNFIAEAQAAVAEAKAAGESELVRRAVIAQLRCALTHKDWLAAHPPRQIQQQKTFDSAARPVIRHTGKTERTRAKMDPAAVEQAKAAKREADRAFREAHKGKGGGGDTRRGQPQPKKGKNAA